MAQPIKKIQKGSISGAVFENQYGKSVVIQKGYKKKDTDEWVNSNINLFLNELQKVKEICDELCKTYAEDIKKEQERKQKAE